MILKANLIFSKYNMANNKNLKSIIKLAVMEAVRYKKETGEDLPNWQEELNEYESKKEYFVHFSHVPRLALYVVNKFDTPIGFYAYQLEFSKMRDFAIERPYAVIVKPKSQSRMLVLKTYTEDQYYNDIDKLKSKYKLNDEEIEEWEMDARVQSPAGFIWNVTRRISIDSASTITEAYNMPAPTESNEEPRLRRPLSPEYQLMRNNYVDKVLNSYQPKNTDDRGGGQTGKWSLIINKVLGYNGVIDDCLGIIHSSEPCQAVFFNTSAVELIKIINKPVNTDTISSLKITYNNKKIINRDFNGRPLAHTDFSYSKLIKINFSNADLNFSTVRGAIISDSNFKSAQLKHATFNNSEITNTNFENADFTSAYLYGASFDNVNFKNTNFSGANLGYVKFYNSNLEGSYLGNLENLSSNIDFKNVNLKNANLKNVKLDGADMENTNFQGAILEGASFWNGNFKNCNFTSADMKNAIVSKASFENANFSDANLSVIIFNKTNLTNANLTNANLEDCYLKNTNLKGANLKGTKFRETVYDKNTVFPDGFNPEESGLKKVEE